MDARVSSQERLTVMLDQRAAGWSYARIAEHHGITKARVGQILGQHETRVLIEDLEGVREL